MLTHIEMKSLRLKITLAVLIPALLILAAVAAVRYGGWMNPGVPARGDTENTGTTPSAPHRSAVLITIDTLRGDHLGYAGNPTIRSPLIDRLSRTSAIFSDAITNQPLTLPAHSAILSSLYPAQLDVLSNYQFVNPDIEMLPELLQKYGFQTAGFPQAILRFPRGTHQGFDVYDGRTPREQKPGRDNRVPNKTRLRAIDDPKPVDKTDRIQTAIDWVREQDRAGERYFLWVHFFEPHTPYTPDPPYRYVDFSYRPSDVDKAMKALGPIWMNNHPNASPVEINFYRQLYKNEILWVDVLMEPLLHCLAHDLSEEPFLIMTSDHGECLYDGDQYYGHGVSLIREEIHVPMLVHDQPVRGFRSPGPADDMPPGRIITRPVHSVDVAPTLLRALGLASPNRYKGLDMLSSLRRPRIIPLSVGDTGHHVGALNSQYKVVWDTETDRWFYWNRPADPGETEAIPLPASPPAQLLPLVESTRDYQNAVETISTKLQPETSEDASFIKMLESLGYLR